jgi:ketosteroid isomerase-like protein
LPAARALPGLYSRTSRQETKMIVSENVLASMRRTNELFESEVIKNRNVNVLENIYTSDARILPPGAAMIEGRDNIKNFWCQTIAGLATQSATLDTVHAESLGDRVFEIGRADLHLAGGQTVSIKYVVLWKEENGQWKWHVDIWNSNQ